MNPSAANPLVQGAEKLWRNVHVLCNAAVTSENPADNVSVIDRRVVEDRMGDNVDSLNGSGYGARDQSENLVGVSGGSSLSPPSVVEARSSSMVPEMSPARSISSLMADTPVPHETLTQATLQEVPITTEADIQPMLQDVPITLTSESSRTDTEAEVKALSKIMEKLESVEESGGDGSCRHRARQQRYATIFKK
ncbi:hypothetical protein V6N13_110931 [Hibiscus sabdariffa]|uniref:Uncharacterized protein n=1 Tax=Hibiscus sabdariffa TaxID=183260 RepID=A0ABR1ZU03_9ROSI